MYRVVRLIVRRKDNVTTSQRRWLCDRTNDNMPGKSKLPNVQNNQWTSVKANDLLTGSRSHDDDSQVEVDFPSDLNDFKTISKNESEKRPWRDPQECSVLLFPGQGSQFVGMGQKLIDYPNVIDMYNKASEILGYNLLKLCLNGPKSELDKTIYCQPAVLVTSLAAVEKLKHDSPEAVENCVATAGFSVGEYAALTFGGTFSFEDAVRLINVRAQAMQEASDETPGGMLVIHTKADSNVGQALKAANLYMKERMGIEKPVCKIANYLFTGCKVLAGHKEGLYFIEKTYKEFNIRRVKHLPVSGAFHSELMESAKEPLREALSCLNLTQPVINVHSNVTGKPFGSGRSIARALVKQVTNQVLWEQTIHRIFQRDSETPVPMTYECGPGFQLQAMLKMTNGKAYKSSKVVEV